MSAELIKKFQMKLIGMGFPLQRFGADGDFGQETYDAAVKALSTTSAPVQAIPQPAPAPATPTSVWPVVPPEWMPACNMDRVICHWSAGTYTVSDLDREHYHLILDGVGKLFRGDHTIDDNVNTQDDDYAAHTRNCNTRSIGVSLACMLNAKEAPFDAGKYPMKREQWEALTSVVAQLCKRYKIAVTSQTVLSHAEVQGTLGIAQAGKWDFTRLAFDPSVKGAKACGGKLRSEVALKLARL